MSSKLKSPEALAELQHTLRTNKHIEEVHFTGTGDHYFNTHELVTKGKATGKFYGHLKTNHEVSKIVGERKFFKLVSVENPEALIVESLTRDEVLALKPTITAAAAQAPVAAEDNTAVSQLMEELKKLREEVTQLKADKDAEGEDGEGEGDKKKKGAKQDKEQKN